MVMKEREVGLKDGGVEEHHHCLGQTKHLQYLQEIYPLQCLIVEGGNVQLSLEVLTNNGHWKVKEVKSGDWRVAQDYGEK